MESEYMAKFKRLVNVDNSFREKVIYRRNRRFMENQHHPFGDEEEREEIDEERRVDSVKTEIRAVPPPEIPQVVFRDRERPEIPVLQLRPTPSPSMSSGIASDDEQPIDKETTDRLEVGTQTTDRFVERAGSARHCAGHNSRIEHPISNGMTAGAYSYRPRRPSPFAVYGNGDRELHTSRKRTFNVKATDGTQVYETAIRAAARKGYPLPERSHKAELLNPKKYPNVPISRLQHSHSFQPSKKSVAFSLGHKRYSAL